MSGPLKVIVLGLDERAKNLFRMFFRGPCQNQAVIVEQESEAEVFLIDLDTQLGNKIYAEQRENHPARILITLSVRDQVPEEGVIAVKKPAQAQSMSAAIAKAKSLASSARPKAHPNTTGAVKPKNSLFSWASRKTSSDTVIASPPTADATPPITQAPPPQKNSPATQPAASNRPQQPVLPSNPLDKSNNARLTQPASRPTNKDMKVVAAASKGENPVHKVAMLLDEQGFKSYLGHRDDIDPNNAEELPTIYYDPKAYLQGHVQSAVKVAFARNEPLKLETPWKTITILPDEGFIHIEADEAQIRAACGIPFRNIVGVDIDAITLQQVVNIKPVSSSELEELLKSKNLTRLDSFVWKIALLTSKGRLPKGVDVTQGFYLKRWPCMTRLLLSPHAMRVAALLTQQPSEIFSVAKRMGIRQQYVFAFVSAAHSLGLITQQPIPNAQSTRETTEDTTLKIQPERKSLFQKILSRLKLI